MIRRLLLCLALVLGSVAPALADAYVASWNVEHLGWGKNKNYDDLAKVAKNFDLIGIQEVMTTKGVDRFVAALEAETAVSWKALISDAEGRGRYKEMYAFLYRPDRITWVGGATNYIDDADQFQRPPFSAEFRTDDGFDFVMTSVHLTYGKSRSDRIGEAKALAKYRAWLDAQFPQTAVFIAGDFNLHPDDSAFGPLEALAQPLILKGNTTISTIDGRFANLYDNIWAPRDVPLPITAVGRVEYPHKILGITHREARETVSDHIPVWMHIDATGPRAVYRGSSSTGM